MIDKSCWDRHVGPWCIEPTRFQALFGLWRSGQLRLRLVSGDLPQAPAPAAAPTQRPYTVTGDGVGIVQIQGVMAKGYSKFADVDTVAVRREIRAMSADQDVRGIFLLIDSPGGMSAGTDELAADIRRAAETKPVAAHIEDLGASAAYWAASQASRISATRTSDVGSIGTMVMLLDESKAYEEAGLRPVVIASGEMKGLGAPGAPITEEQENYIRSRIEAHNQFFLDAVKRGRNASAAQVREWSSGRTWVASEAKERGLIDSIESTDEALAWVSKRANSRRRLASARAQIALMEMD